MVKLDFFEGYLIVDDVFLAETESEKYLENLLNKKQIEDVFSNLNGSYRFSFSKDNIIYFTTDHFGGYPLFYQRNPFKIILNPYLEKNKRICDDNFLEFLSFGFTIGNKTIYENIFECNPGTLYSYFEEKKSLQKTIWFEYSYQSKTESNPEYLSEILIKSVKPFISENLYLPLTAGLDTRTILAININLGNLPTIFSNGNLSNRDVKIAQKIADIFKLNFHHNNYDSDVKEKYFKDSDFKKMVEFAFWGRSLPHDLEWISAKNISRNSRMISGHSGDWISGSYLSAELLRIKSHRKLILYLLKKNPSLTGISDKNQQYFLYQSLKNYVKKKNLESAESIAEIFEFENHQRKYNVNSAWIYRGLNKESYLPFFDRRILTLFKNLKLSEKIDEKLYIQTLKKNIFIDKAKVLSEIQTSRTEFYSKPKSDIFIKSKIADLINTFDWKRKRKIFANPNKRWEEVMMLFSENPAEFYSKKIKDAFPGIFTAIDYLEGIKAEKSANHLKIIANYRVAQIQINGLFILKMLPYFLEIK